MVVKNVLNLILEIRFGVDHINLSSSNRTVKKNCSKMRGQK